MAEPVRTRPGRSRRPARRGRHGCAGRAGPLLPTLAEYADRWLADLQNTVRIGTRKQRTGTSSRDTLRLHPLPRARAPLARAAHPPPRQRLRRRDADGGLPARTVLLHEHRPAPRRGAARALRRCRAGRVAPREPGCRRRQATQLGLRGRAAHSRRGTTGDGGREYQELEPASYPPHSGVSLATASVTGR
jgi:hypothetical protein